MSNQASMNNYLSPRNDATTMAKLNRQAEDFTSPNFKITINIDNKATKTVGKKNGTLRSLERSMGKPANSRVQVVSAVKRNFIPTTSGVTQDPAEVLLEHNHISLRLEDSKKFTSGQSPTKESLAKGDETTGERQTLHSRLTDIKEQLNPLLDTKIKCQEIKYQSKFRRSGVVQPSGLYESKGNLPSGSPSANYGFGRRKSNGTTRGVDILTDGGLRALSKMDQQHSTPI